MKREFVLLVFLVLIISLGMVFVGCDDGTTDDNANVITVNIINNYENPITQVHLSPLFINKDINIPSGQSHTMKSESSEDYSTVVQLYASGLSGGVAISNTFNLNRGKITTITLNSNAHNLNIYERITIQIE